ncbi:MAG: hypothetical protein IIB95_00925 [Candidatus Marinimicrobia bacterium]|nr:hypothetical protein [Candidatus Neomarinimicrobiota bacterium]MCH7762287.1 hypothetical protein [Candidatus Neomarinimicrobiota bacterium]
MNRSKIIIVFFICAILLSFAEIFGKDAGKLRIVKTIQITPDGQYYQDPKVVTGWKHGCIQRTKGRALNTECRWNRSYGYRFATW